MLSTLRVLSFLVIYIKIKIPKFLIKKYFFRGREKESEQEKERREKCEFPTIVHSANAYNGLDWVRRNLAAGTFIQVCMSAMIPIT